MKFPYRKTIVSAALMLASSGLIMAQQTSTVQTSPAQRQTESVARHSPSSEEELQQSLLRIATIYREMAVTSPTDSVAVRDIKSQFARLAEEQEKAASAASAMAAHHAQLVALIRRSAIVTTRTRHSIYGDSAFRR